MADQTPSSPGREYPVIRIYVTHRGLSGEQLMFRYAAPPADGEEIADTDIRAAIGRATARLAPFDILDVEVFVTTPRIFDVRHGIEERR